MEEVKPQGKSGTDAFRRRFLQWAPLVVAFVALLLLAVELSFNTGFVVVIAVVVAAGVNIAAAWLIIRDRFSLASSIFVYGNIACIALSAVMVAAIEPPHIYALTIFLITSVLLLQTRAVLILGGLVTALTIGVNSYGIVAGTLGWTSWLGSGFLLLLTLGAYLSSLREERSQGTLGNRATSMEDLVREVLIVASRLGASTGEIHAMMKEQTGAASSQAKAVKETRHVLKSVTEASGEIVAAATLALENAEVTFKNSEQVSRNIEVLTHHTRQITAILESIREVANKSDLLALNAALEGARAGEAGQGFSLVANQMQRLAETTTSFAKDIQELTEDIDTSMKETRLSVEETMKLASATNDVSQKINGFVQNQRNNVDQMSTSMDDIVSLTTKVTDGTDQTINATGDLQELAESLIGLVKSHAISD